MVVSINNLWEHIIAILNSTIVNPLGAPLRKKRGSQKCCASALLYGFPHLLVLLAFANVKFFDNDLSHGIRLSYGMVNDIYTINRSNTVQYLLFAPSADHEL